MNKIKVTFQGGPCDGKSADFFEGFDKKLYFYDKDGNIHYYIIEGNLAIYKEPELNKED